MCISKVLSILVLQKHYFEIENDKLVEGFKLKPSTRKCCLFYELLLLLLIFIRI